MATPKALAATLPEQPVELDKLVKEAFQESNYLFENNAEVIASCETSLITLTLPKEASRIIISNLIRNAFQHTVNGQVQIKHEGSRVTVTNDIKRDYKDSETKLGFGLGLALSKKLAARFSWHLSIQTTTDHHIVCINF